MGPRSSWPPTRRLSCGLAELWGDEDLTSIRPVTIDDVAARAGVSVATVSRALRGLPNVALSTRDRVLAVAEELRYYPDPHASRLASGRTHTIGLAVPQISQWYFSQVIAGVESALSAAGYDLLVYGASTPSDRARLVSDALPMRNRVDGVILVDLFVPPDEAAGWAARGVRLVTIGHRADPFPAVTVDDRAASAVAVRHLINLGHREIAIIGGQTDDIFRFTVPHERRYGYEDALREGGLPIRVDLHVLGNFSIEGGTEAMNQLLAISRPPTAVFAMSDEMAFGAIAAVRDHGLRVPEDISVVGFDDHEMAGVMGLTTIKQPAVDHGVRAARLILDAIGGALGPRVEVMPTKLVVRATTRPPRVRVLEGSPPEY